MEVLRVLIVEDDDDQANTIRGYLDRFSEQHGVSIQVSRMRSALELLDGKRRFDLILMDIDLPGISGMDAIRKLREYDQETQVIFVTNLAQYAVSGYEVDALDFMVKPVRYIDFMIRMEKALRVLSRRQDKNLLITNREGVQIISSRNLAYADVLDHEIAYHLVSGELITHRASLNKLEEELEGLSFVRISKSCLVNVLHVRSIVGAAITMTTGDVVYVSRNMRKTALAAIANYYGGNS